MIRAFSLIEAIVCIVVLGIAMLTLPNLIFQSTQNHKTALMQQGVMDTKSLMQLALNLPFDCAQNFTQTPIFAKNLDNFYDKNEIDVSLVPRRIFAKIDTNEKCEKGSNFQSIDDVNNLSFEATNMNSNRLFANSQMNVSVALKSINGEQNENIKEIKIINKIKNGDLNQEIIMRGYVANLGSLPQILTKKLQ
ncbi:MAG: type IV pilus modification PilV family protein [Campylobacter sp.]